MKKNTVKMIASSLVVSMLLIVSMSGCGGQSNKVEAIQSDKAEPVAVDYYEETEFYDTINIVGVTREFSEATYREAATEISKGVYNPNGFTLNVISTTGRPEKIESKTIPALDQDVKASALEAAANTRVNEIITYSESTAVADCPEADLVKALHLAARLDESSEGGRSLVVVSDSGINPQSATLGYSDVELRDTGSIVETLTIQHQLPRFRKGTKVVLIGLGEVDGIEQAQPNELGVDKLKEVYKAILVAGGVKKDDIEFKTVGKAKTQRRDLPEVTVVPVNNVSVFTEEELNFKVGSSEFINVAAAELTMKSAMASYRNNSKLIVCGFTSSEGDPHKNLELSKERAKVVAEYMRKNGFSSIKEMGLGYNEAYCDNDSSSESIRRANRKVIIVDEETVLGQRLLAEGQ